MRVLFKDNCVGERSMKQMVRIAAAAAFAASPALAAPPAYVVAELVQTDPVAYARDYAPHVPPLVAAHGGRYLARGGAVEELEGVPPAGHSVIIEFPSMEAARAFWTSREYQALGAVRRKSSTGRIYLLEGATQAAVR